MVATAVWCSYFHSNFSALSRVSRAICRFTACVPRLVGRPPERQTPNAERETHTHTHTHEGLSTPLTILPECISSKTPRQSLSGTTRLRIGSTSILPLPSREITDSQIGQL